MTTTVATPSMSPPLYLLSPCGGCGSRTWLRRTLIDGVWRCEHCQGESAGLRPEMMP